MKFIEGISGWKQVAGIAVLKRSMFRFHLLLETQFMALTSNQLEVVFVISRRELAEIELDNFLMGSAVVVSALYIHYTEGLGPNRGSEILSEVVNVSINDIKALAIIITQMVLGTRVTFTTFA